jgi:hypothetical protein
MLSNTSSNINFNKNINFKTNKQILKKMVLHKVAQKKKKKLGG